MMGTFEPLNEPGHDGRGLVVRGKHWLIIGNPQDINRKHRTLVFEMFHSDWITFSSYHDSYRDHVLTEVFITIGLFQK